MDDEHINSKAVLFNTAYIKDFSRPSVIFILSLLQYQRQMYPGKERGGARLHSSCIGGQGAFLLQAWDRTHCVPVQPVWTTALLSLSCQGSSFGMVEWHRLYTFTRNWNWSVVFKTMLFWHGFTDSNRICMFVQAPFWLHARHSLCCQASFQLLRVQRTILFYLFFVCVFTGNESS